MQQIRWVIAVAGCLIGGVICLYRFFSGVPALERLIVIEGQVASADLETRRSRRSGGQYLAVRLREERDAFNYPDWFPEFDRMTRALAVGDRVKMWVDEGRNDWIWQMERNGERVVSFDQVAEAVKDNNRFGGIVGFGLVAVAAIVLVIAVRRWRKTQPSTVNADEKGWGS